MIEAKVVKRFAARKNSAPFALDVDIGAGNGITAIFGPSGAGKTLLLDCLAGFVAPDSGRILLDDAIVFDAAARVNVRPQDRRCGYVFQNYALFPHMTLRENLQFAAAVLPVAERARALSYMLDRFRLREMASRKPHELSGGQKQRASIARALITAPRILLLDEPARGLDASLRADLYAVLREVRAAFASPILLVTHSLEECFELGDRMIVLQGGGVAQTGSPGEVCSRPATLDLARLLGVFNILPAEICALDPSRNTSVLRVNGVEVAGEYYPGHLKGDRVHLLATARQLTARPKLGALGANEIPAVLLRAVDTADGARLEFEGGIVVDALRPVPDRNTREWIIEAPRRGLRVL